MTENASAVRERDIRERAIQRLIAEEALRDEQEQAEAAVREAQAVAQWRARREVAEASILSHLKALVPLYEERSQRAQAALSVLSEFVESDLQLQQRESGLDVGDAYLGLEPTLRDERLQGLRMAAGLPSSRNEIGVAGGRSEAERIALTALRGIVRRLIYSNGIQVGSRIVTLP